MATAKKPASTKSASATAKAATKKKPASKARASAKKAQAAAPASKKAASKAPAPKSAVAKKAPAKKAASKKAAAPIPAAPAGPPRMPPEPPEIPHRPTTRLKTSGLYNRILLPVDLRHESSWNKVLPLALAHIRHHGARVTVMTVVPDDFAGVDWRYAVRREGDKERDHTVEETRQNLAKLVADQVPSEFSVDQFVARGTIYKEILKAARTVRADWIIMASQRPSLKDYLLGPNAARVVRHANCSVSVVRE